MLTVLAQFTASAQKISRFSNLSQPECSYARLHFPATAASIYNTLRQSITTMKPDGDNDLSSSGAMRFDSPGLNTRKAVRYGRHDIKAELIGRSLFLLPKAIVVELQDISTRGAHLLCQHKLAVNARFMLRIIFDSGKRFDIEGKVVHKKSPCKGAYGFQFTTCNDALGDYLLETQTDLVFK